MERKTVLVVYSDEKKKDYGMMKRYCFNTSADVKVGDMIETDRYDTNVIVVEVLEKEFKYFSRSTGELSDVIKGTDFFRIKELRVVDKVEADVVTGWKVED